MQLSITCQYFSRVCKLQNVWFYSRNCFFLHRKLFWEVNSTFIIPLSTKVTLFVSTHLLDLKNKVFLKEGLDGVNWQLENGRNFNWQLTNRLTFNWQLTLAFGFTVNWQRAWLFLTYILNQVGNWKMFFFQLSELINHWFVTSATHGWGTKGS